MLAHAEVGRRSRAPWLRVAEGELSVRELPGPGGHPRILSYHRATALAAWSDETPWCSSFVNWCLLRADRAGTGSAAARSWLDWGHELCEPVPGSIVVLEGERPWEGHVGFLLERQDSEVLVLGGNQADEVSIRPYPAGRVLGYRWPAR